MTAAWGHCSTWDHQHTCDGSSSSVTQKSGSTQQACLQFEKQSGVSVSLASKGWLATLFMFLRLLLFTHIRQPHDFQSRNCANTATHHRPACAATPPYCCAPHQHPPYTTAQTTSTHHCASLSWCSRPSLLLCPAPTCTANGSLRPDAALLLLRATTAAARHPTPCTNQL